MARGTAVATQPVSAVRWLKVRRRRLTAWTAASSSGYSSRSSHSGRPSSSCSGSSGRATAAYGARAGGARPRPTCPRSAQGIVLGSGPRAGPGIERPFSYRCESGLQVLTVISCSDPETFETLAVPRVGVAASRWRRRQQSAQSNRRAGLSRQARSSLDLRTQLGTDRQGRLLTSTGCTCGRSGEAARR
jgi:hypothetical protein